MAKPRNPKVQAGSTLTNPNNRPAGHGGGGGSVGPYTSPPFMSYDPQIEAERRAGRRGLKDILKDTKIEGIRAGQDLHQALRDTRVKAQRGRQDINTQAFRGNQKLGFQASDARLRAGRNIEDFHTQLSNLTRQFATLGHQQAQQANVAGVLDAGTLAAGAQQRAQNFAIARQPIDTGIARTKEDLGTALGRIGIARHQLGVDTGRARTRLRQDTKRDRRLSRQEFKRGKQDRGIKRQRAKREQAISDTNLLVEEIYNARQNHPGVFGKYGKKQNKKG